ncbi:MAG TPA: hypothetical protein VGQ59_06185 [Cyclobacteriaceae bacterium]|jgi:hypothetical protein|nr:hypothetical protein [Cyclobacteriaceae bacterium]
MIKRVLTFLILVFVSLSVQLQAQDSLATIYFYKHSKFSGSVQGYDIKNGDAVIGKIHSNSVLTYRAKPGNRFFTATIEGESSFRLTLEAGRTYFVECGTEGGGVAISRPTFQQISRANAKKEIAKIDIAVANAIPDVDAVTLQSQARDSLATVYFYRGGQVAGFAISYDVKQAEKIIGRIGVNTVIRFRAKPGAQTFKATTEGESSIHLILDAGKTYFVECGLAVGALAGRPTFRQTFSEVAKKKIESIDPIMAKTIPEYLPEVIQQSDTTRALQNLFQRKRKGGTTRAVVFGTLGIISLISTTNKQTVNAGGQNVDVSPDNTGAYLFSGFSIVMMITGIVQTSNYSSEKLEMLLADHNKGTPLPQKIKSKLKQKDFK